MSSRVEYAEPPSPRRCPVWGREQIKTTLSSVCKGFSLACFRCGSTSAYRCLQYRNKLRSLAPNTGSDRSCSIELSNVCSCLKKTAKKREVCQKSVSTSTGLKQHKLIDRVGVCIYCCIPDPPPGISFSRVGRTVTCGPFRKDLRICMTKARLFPVRIALQSRPWS